MFVTVLSAPVHCKHHSSAV